MDTDAVLHVSTSDPTPPYEQLRRQLVDLIGAGRLDRGQRLPPVRQLASDLGLAVGTVARTYRELEAEGLVVTRRGGGTRVSDDAPHRSTSALAGELQDLATGLVRQARRLGASDEQIRGALEAVLETSPAPGRTRRKD
jgi:GntR family transcriptional regulator